mgnify:CR=1 FL=1
MFNVDVGVSHTFAAAICGLSSSEKTRKDPSIIAATANLNLHRCVRGRLDRRGQAGHCDLGDG